MRINTKSHLYTHEGAKAKKINPEQQLKRSVLACLLWEKQFYENGYSIADRIIATADQCSAEFVSQLAIDARTKFKLRHAPLLLLLSLSQRGGKIVRKTVREVINRPDEMAELIALLWRNKKRALPRQLSKGIADAFIKFDEYQFAKWNRDNDIKLRDVMFLTHPKPADKTQEALFKKIADNRLSPPDTWESRLTGGEDKKAVFEDLLSRNKLGYMALLRNLRNMQSCNVDEKLITDAIAKPSSSVLPYRFIAASKHAPQLEKHLDKAMIRLLDDQQPLPGKTCLMVDVSGSMLAPLSSRSDLSRMDAACGLAILLSGICAQLKVFTFSDRLCQVPPRTGMALRDAIINSQPHGMTQMGLAVREVNRMQWHDRLIIITDEQSQSRIPDPDTLAYVMNVASYQNGIGYGKWIHIDGFSEACIEFIREFEKELPGK